MPLIFPVQGCVDPGATIRDQAEKPIMPKRGAGLASGRTDLTFYEGFYRSDFIGRA